ncbi:MAG: RHS repeat-associated core domain-containing protein [Desulfobulbaceae bacterium]
MKAKAYLRRAFQIVFIIHLVCVSVPAQAVETTHNGITLSWDALPLTDIAPGPSETWNNNYYYQSAQFSPEGDWLSVRITLPAEYVEASNWGSRIYLYDPTTGSIMADTGTVYNWVLPVEDLELVASVPVNVTNNETWNAFMIGVDVSAGDDYSGFVIFLSASLSLRTSLEFNPDKSGGPDDNPWTVFDLSDGPGCPGEQGLPYYSVNTATLNLVVQDSDYISAGAGPEIATTRSWNKASSQQGMFGNGWTFPYESTLTTNCFGASLKKGSGQVVHYNARLCDPAPATFPFPAESPDGVLDTLTLMSGDYWIWEERSTKHQYRYDFLATNEHGEKTYRLTSLADKNGNTATLTYDPNGRISAITDAYGRSLSFTHDANGRCRTMTTPDGKTASYAYDGNGNLIQTLDLLGTEIAYTYDADNYMTSMRVADKTTTFVYDEADGWFHVASITDANGKTKTYRSPQYRRHEITDARGNITTYISDSAGRSLAVTNAVSAFTKWEYNYTSGLPASATDANGRTTLMEYDARGNLTKLTDPLGKVTTFTFDADDNMLTRTNALDQTWNYDYDGNGNLIGMTTPMGFQATMTYDVRGRLASMTDENNRTIAFTYDSFGNIETVKDPLNNTTTYEYDVYGINRTKRTTADGKSTQYEYDNNRRLTKETYADGTFRTYSYDACSLMASTDEKGNRTELTRDNLLNILRITNPLGNSVASEYDANSNLTSLTDALNHKYVNTYDSENRLTQIKNAAGTTLVKKYDAVGNMTELSDERGKKTFLTYDKNNRHATTIDPLGNTVTNQRDALGRITQVTNARGGQIGFAYDPDGRMTQKTYNGTVVATYGYDNAGNMTSVVDATGTTTYRYNALNKVDRIEYPDTTVLSFAYDQMGNVTTITYPGGLVVGYSYDLRNRVQAVTWDSQSISYQYDAAGNPLKIVRPNSTESIYAFDATNRIVEIDHQQGATSFAKMTYTRDAVGNIVRETNTLPVSPSVSGMTMAAHYTDANQIDTWRNHGYTYDADGNITQIKDIFTDEVSWSAVYDQQNRLTQLTRGTATATYAYDGAGNRTKAVVGGAERNYHYDHLGRLIYETDGSGAMRAQFIYAGERLVAQKNSGSSYFYHFDKAGNTLALTNASGGIVNAYAYTPFGQGAGSSGTLYNPFTYVGEFGVMSEGGNIYFMKNRYYDAVTGRFIQKDPIGFTGGQSNLYAYVGNNPVEQIDPAGTAWWEDIAVGAAAAGGYAAVLVATGTPVGWGVLAVGGAAMTLKKGYDLVTTQAPKTAEALEKAGQSVSRVGRASRYLVRTCEMSDRGTMDEKINMYYQQRGGQVGLWNVFVEAKDAMVDAAGESLKTAYKTVEVVSGLKKISP